VVDLHTVPAADLEEFWQREARWWREQLCWDVSDTLAALRRVVERRGVPGKAVQVGSRTVGCTYYTIVRRLGVIAGLHVLPEWSNLVVGSALLQETLSAIRQHPVVRIESPCLAIDCPWLISTFEPQGFHTYWREFRRLELPQEQERVPPHLSVHLEPWQGTQVREAAAIMQAAYAGSVDAEINTLYRSAEGCHQVLEDILYQGSCGRLVAEASVLARHRGQGIGFILVTEIAPRQSHVVQVMVLPTYQRQGVGRLLLCYSMARLAALHYAALSLIVSRANAPARQMYQARGLHTVLAFPAFIWEQSASDP
jgi:ribosomal protein S18 acetylase RimI-like enzyme